MLIEQDEKEISGVKAIGEQLDLWMLYFYAIKSPATKKSDLLILKNKAV